MNSQFVNNASEASTEVPARRGLLRSPYALLMLIFAVSRAIYYLLGVRFDARGIPIYLQFIDTELLRHHLLQSLFYLHWQPPGYNLFLGCVLKFFPHPSAYTAAFHIIHLLFGAALAWCLLYMMRSLGVGVRIALAATSVFIISPGVVLFENFILYEYQMLFLLIVSGGLLFHFFNRRSIASAIGFLVCQFWLVMVRNQYHLVYFAAIFILLLYFTKHNRKLVAWTGSLLLAVVLALYLKNQILFGHFASSTWMEMGMGPLLLHQMTSEERHSLASQGKLSATAADDSLYGSDYRYGIPLSVFRPYVTMPAKTSIPVLDDELKSSGVVNYNNVGYLEAQKLYKKDIAFILRHYPIAYIRSFAIAWFTYFMPPDDFLFFENNLPHVKFIQRFFDVVFFGQFKQAPGKELRRLYGAGAKFSLIFYTGIFLLIALPALFIFGSWYLYRGIRRRTLTIPQVLLLGFLLFNIAYCTASANLLSSFENNRYRFPVDGFFLVIAVLALDRLLRTFIYKTESRLP
ncbi:MAG: hypothetical protein ABSF80_01955 [Chitinispirillaceae bacterium]|jgi:hypothetical protein